jgi:hypothetical protein
MKARHLVFGTILMLAVTSIVSAAEVQPPNPLTTEVVGHHDLILQKVSEKAVPSQYTPIFIYGTYDGTPIFVGSGSVFTDSDGEQVITAEHLFLKKYGTCSFTWRKIRPLESDIKHGILSVFQIGKDILPDGDPDIMVLKSGDHSNAIECFSGKDQLRLQENINFLPFSEPQTLTSLVTGKKVSMLGQAWLKEKPKELYYVINYACMEGESGSGFVDENDNIFVLNGTCSLQTAEGKPALNVTDGISIVYGPLGSPK